MYNLNTTLEPDEAVVMRAIWDTGGWLTVDDICSHIWQEGYNRNKVYRILCRLLEINFVSMKKYRGKNYYAQRVTVSQYYPDLCEDPEEFLANETINVKGMEYMDWMRKLKDREKSIAKLIREEKRRGRSR